jgi:hypothetical protein
MSEECQRCKENGEDRRTLYMTCFYEMAELGLPFDNQDMFETSDPRENPVNFYTLRVCKECRSEWLHAIQDWFNASLPGERFTACGSGIYVRDFGANREVTDEEWRKMHPDHNPVRVINES